MDKTSKRKSYVLKIALFATGLAGIVAQYLLATLATYFLNDSVMQWSLIVSIMLFSMGLGSRISMQINDNLLSAIVMVEIGLSLLTSLSAMFVYIIAAYTVYTGFFIYLLSILIGLLIGMEIPLVTRINEKYETLRYNIAGVMAWDYFGSLLGGLFFVFVGLPLLGTTYTPFVLGGINFIVAIWLFIRLKEILNRKHLVSVIAGFSVAAVVLIAGIAYAKPIQTFSEQVKYQDKIILQEQSKYQHIVLTQWRQDYWLYIDGNQQLSTLDEFLYHEPLVHPAMSLLKHPTHALVVGGGDGCAVRELLKYSSLEKIVLVDLDPLMTRLAKVNNVFLKFNHGALNNTRVEVVNTDGFKYLEKTAMYFDIIIVDLPDPNRIELNKLYTLEFYQLAQKVLRPAGVFITQAGSPYYASKAFHCIKATMNKSGFHTLPLHNQVLTLGQWGWIIGSRQYTSEELKHSIRHADISAIDTRWLNPDALFMITSFGKNVFGGDDVAINTISNPVLYQYYRKGRWDLY